MSRVAPSFHLEPSTSPKGRWVVLLVVTILLHTLVVRWLNHGLQLPHPVRVESTPVSVLLQTPATPLLTQAQARPSDVKRPVKRTPRPASPPRTAAGVLASAPSSAAVPGDKAITESDATTTATTTAVTPAQETTQVAADKPVEKAAETPSKKANAPVYGFTLLPSAKLKYDLSQTKPDMANPLSGSGRITWKTDGTNFTTETAFNFLFSTIYSNQSSGKIDGSGLAPDLFSETRNKRSQTNTHFNRDERANVSFSATDKTFALGAGAQDRASIIWQLAAVGRASADQFPADANISVQVASERELENWEIHVFGYENIETRFGMLSTWHVARLPRPDSYDKRIDLWFAPTKQWYPVKIRHTEKNGTVIELNLTDLDTTT